MPKFKPSKFGSEERFTATLRSHPNNGCPGTDMETNRSGARGKKQRNVCDAVILVRVGTMFFS